MTDEPEIEDADTEPSPPYEACSEDEIKHIAVDIHAGRIFTSNHCLAPEDVRLAFMTTLFMDESHWQYMQDNDITVIYEYMDKAGPRSVNGYPSFFSHNCLSAGDWKRVVEKLKALEAAVEAL